VNRGDELNEQSPPTEEYLKPSEVARILHVSPKTVDRWANQGRIPCIVTLGGHRRFARADVAGIANEMVRRGKAKGSE
jgi:excisionase family DNA binding protein